MKTYIAFNIDGGYTELLKKYDHDDFDSEQVENCQVLLIEEAENIGEFVEKVKTTWTGFDIGEIEVREINKKSNYFHI